ncbi:MAG: putative nitrilase, partial [Bacteroidetes bacterium]|nr:putative nitrilase [Bacteroidota bacterium]
MSKNKAVSRRNFLKKSGAGAGLIGLSAYSSNLIAGNTVLERSDSDLGKSSPREVRVLSISRSGLENNKNIVNEMITRIRTLSVFKPDIICLPEVINGKPAKEAEEVPGPTTNLLSAVAKEFNCYIICPIHSRTDGKIFNSAILIDRKGMVAGQYNKI